MVDRSLIPPGVHRRHPRIAVRRTVTVYDSQGRRHSARLRDYSSQGVGLLHPEQLSIGQKLALRLVDDQGRGIPIVFRVVHSCPTEGGGWRIGAELTWSPATSAATLAGTGQLPADAPQQPAEPPTLPPPASPSREAVDPPMPVEMSLPGKTTTGWDRVLDVRVETGRVWLNMHPPGGTSGWGLFVDRAALLAAIGS